MKRPSALRAIILYPLNALVEDQLRRLRSTLDSDAVHYWLGKERGGNFITFGRYTSLTPVSGPETDPSRSRLRSALREAEEQQKELLKALRQYPSMDIAKDYFPRLDGGEMWSRWDMQETPPDILITNYSMLNIMLMRSIENSIFEKTRAWLEEPHHPERVFHLIIDELHAYRGTPGTEVAYIIRLLLSRLGLKLDSPKLRILATTASLDPSSKGKKFLREFFGRDNFEFIETSQKQPQGTYTDMQTYQRAFERFALRVQPDPLDPMAPPNKESNVALEAMKTLAERLGAPSETTLSAKESLGRALISINAPDSLRDACQAVNGSVRPTQIPHLDKKLFPNADTRGIASPALRGLLLALGMSEVNGRSPQPVRGHLFFHNLQNIWACCNPNCNDTKVHASRNQQQGKGSTPTVGALYTTHRLSCPACGSRVLDLIVCEVCGDIFLGGYKAKSVTGDPPILTADQPDLENMPDRVVVEQRYEQYAVFWPLPGEQSAWSTEPQQPTWIQQDSRTKKPIQRKWVKAKLNQATGQLIIGKKPPEPGQIPGWLYSIADEHTKERALPSRCPRCDADYHAHQNPSPLRNHRTGFQKSCQVLASAALREIPQLGKTTEMNTRVQSSRKLVIFSDSRQDAAKLAAGMERDHYRDMVRLSLIHSFSQYWRDLEAFLGVLVDQSSASLPKLKALNAELYTKIVDSEKEPEIERYKKFMIANPELSREGNNWWQGLPFIVRAVYEDWLATLRQYPGRVPLWSLQGVIRDTLLELGLCPGGTNFKEKNYNTGLGRSERWRPWYECYDWTNSPATQTYPIQQEQTKHLSYLESKLIAELMYALFPHIARTLEGLGQGWVSYDLPEGITQTTVQATDTVVRQLATRRRHIYSGHYPPGTKEEMPTYATKYLSTVGVSQEDVKQQLLQSDATTSTGRGLALDPKGLYLVPPPEITEKGRQPGYRCESCNAFYLHPAAGACPECNKRLIADTTLSDFDYYVYLSKQSGPPFRMNCEELTGQTDRNNRVQRQRWFQDIFINKEISAVQGIDLLSVTTTMEAGVDIGALLATMMANMPPRRFNYQQRVGRAGRRGVGVSLAITFCRGRSHDDFYFLRTESMTGDPPPPPYVDMSSEPILRRVLVKEVLRQAFETSKKTSAEAEANGNTESVHGEFGTTTEWREKYRQQIADWLQNPKHLPAMQSVIDILRIETKWHGTAGLAFRDQMQDYLLDELIPQIDSIIDDESYSQDALSERLANAGLLPMFGFPTRVRMLYTKWPPSGVPWPPEEGTVDRDLDIALSQFAPGSQTVKDKAVYTACGVVDLRPAGNAVQTQPGFFPDLNKLNSHPIGICGNCQAVRYLPAMQQFNPGNQKPEPIICTVCNTPSAMLPLDTREPKGFFTDLQPQDFEGQFEWTARSTRPTLNIDAAATTLSIVNNAAVGAIWDNIHTINDNAGAGGFDFYDARIDDTLKPGAYTVEPENTRRVKAEGPSRRVALLSRRRTDVLLVDIQDWPKGIFADPMKVEGRASWYSFAFWLRIVAGALLDVDPQELQSGFRSLIGSGVHNPIGQAFLCDQLENGAGYCRYLAQPSEFQKMLQQADATYVSSNGLPSVASKWMNRATSIDHGLSCDTSCNLCIRDFGNLAYHGLLDWRLALDMARVASSGQSRVDLFSNWNGQPNPWRNLVEGTIAPVPTLLRQLGYNEPYSFGMVRVYKHSRQKKLLIECHPLWQEGHPDYQSTYADAQRQFSDCEIKPMNPFMVLRRPAAYI